MSHDKETQTSSPVPGVYGLLAEYHDHHELIEAAKKVRDKGYQYWDCYSPFPVHGIDPAMGIKRTRLPWVVLVLGLTGTTTAFTVQWWTNAVDYPWIISGKPMWSFAANVPIGFELSVLFAAITTFLSMLIFNGLPKWSSPLDRVKRFARASDDRFFLVIEARDPKYDVTATRALLEGTHGAQIVEAVPGDEHLSSDRIPPGIIYGVLIVAVTALIPFGLSASARNSLSTTRQFNIVPNMDYQQKYKAQRANPFFDGSDGRADRGVIAGTVAVGELREDAHFYEGKVDAAPARTFPDAFKIDDAAMLRGQERFGIYCAPCHGLTGDGDGMVHRHAFALQEGTWVKPTNVNDPTVTRQSVGELFNTISNGIRNMPGYARQIPPEDRWAIILYVRALQKSQSEFVADAAQPSK